MKGEIKKPVTEQDVRAWERGWTDMMVTIWRENIVRLGILDTRRLYDSLSGKVTDVGGQITIAHEFMLYGIYVAHGVGRGYRRGNSGKDDENGLKFLDQAYRKVHRLGKARTRRDWFASRYVRDIRVLNLVERDLYGEAYMGTYSNAVTAMFGGGSAIGSQGTDVSRTLASL